MTKQMGDELKAGWEDGRAELASSASGEAGPRLTRSEGRRRALTSGVKVTGHGPSVVSGVLS